MIKKFFLFVLLLIAGGVVGLYFLRDQRLQVVLTEEDLRETIEEAFPIQKSYLLIVTLSLADPEVQLTEDSDRIVYGMRATVSAGGYQFGGSGRVSGTIRYDAEKRELYLVDSRLEDLAIDGLPAEYGLPLREVANLATRQVFQEHPVYRLEDSFLGNFRGAVALKDVEIADGEVRLSFGLADRFWNAFMPDRQE